MSITYEKFADWNGAIFDIVNDIQAKTGLKLTRLNRNKIDYQNTSYASMYMTDDNDHYLAILKRRFSGIFADERETEIARSVIHHECVHSEDMDFLLTRIGSDFSTALKTNDQNVRVAYDAWSEFYANKLSFLDMHHQAVATEFSGMFMLRDFFERIRSDVIMCRGQPKEKVVLYVQDVIRKMMKMMAYCMGTLSGAAINLNTFDSQLSNELINSCFNTLWDSQWQTLHNMAVDYNNLTSMAFFEPLVKIYIDVSESLYEAVMANFKWDGGLP